MKKHLRCLLILFVSGAGIAQSPQLDWVRSFGVVGDATNCSSAIIDSNKSVIVTGRFRGTVDVDGGVGVYNLVSNGDQDMFVAEYDSSGNFKWAFHIGGPQGDIVYDIKFDSQGNIFVLGMFQGTADMDPGSGVQNFTAIGVNSFLSKFDNNGNFIWSKQLIIYEVTLLELDASDNIILGGDFAGTQDFDPGPGFFNMNASNVADDMFMMKLDANGNFLWAKQFQNGGTAAYQQFSIESDAQGNLFMAGNFNGATDFDPGAAVLSIASNGSDDAFVLSLAATGDLRWARTFGSTGTDKAFAMKIDATGNCFTTGEFNGTVDFDPGAGINNISGSGILNAFILKLDNNGNFVFAKHCNGYSFGQSIEIDADGDIYIAGGFDTTVDFDPGAGVANLSDGELFVLRLDADGNFRWLAGFQSPIFGSYQSSYCAIKVDALKNVYYASQFSFTTDFDPTPGQNLITPIGNGDAFILRLAPCRAGISNLTQTACGSYTLNGTTYNLTGNYTQSVSTSSGCDSLIQLNLTINPLPTPSLGKDTSVCANAPIVLSPGQFDNYAWSSGETSNAISVNTPGIYWVTVTNGSNCNARDSIEIDAAASCGTGCVITADTRYFPNPATDTWIINKSNTDCIVFLNMYNALGQLCIKNRRLIDGTNTIDIRSLAAGTYFFRLHNGSEILKTGKFVKLLK